MKLGNGEFWQGDCLELMADIPDGSVDMILCDLPYGTTACKWDTVIPFEPLWEHYWRVAKPNAAIVLTASQPFTSALVMSQIKNFKYEWIWQKAVGSNFASLKYQPMKEHESVLVFSQGTHNYYPIKQPRAESGTKRLAYGHKGSSTGESGGSIKFNGFDPDTYDKNFRNPSSVQYFNNREKSRGLHPTQKPVALFEYLIKTYTNPGDTILDNCAGSGTTAIAAERTGRRWLCIEQDQEYCEKACNRVKDELHKLL